MSNLKKYRIKVFFNTSVDVIVDAVNETQAHKKAQKIADETDFNELENYQSEFDFSEVIYEYPQ